MKPIIGISTSLDNFDTQLARVYVNEEYVIAIEKAGGIPILLPPINCEEDIKKQAELCDGFLFSGGVDINPLFYGEEPIAKLGEVRSAMDKHQVALAKYIMTTDKSYLGICRGHQILNIANGGTLYQDLGQIPGGTIKHVQEGKRFDECHFVENLRQSVLTDIFGQKFLVNSFHHQCIDKLGNGLDVIARASDGVIEGVTMTNKKFVVGVQWHPESMVCNNEGMLNLFKKLVESCI